MIKFSDSFGGTTTWTNPYRYDGRDGVRYDGETGLYWMSVRAYDPALGRFLSRDPLGRVPLFFADQPYVYAGNNPLLNVDPSGQFMATEGVSNAQAHAIMKQKARIYWTPPRPRKGWNGCYEGDRACQGAKAKHDAQGAYNEITNQLVELWGKAFKDWLNEHFNIFEKLIHWTLDQVLDWLGGESAKALFSTLTKDGTGAQVWMLAPWLASMWEANQDASWFRVPKNIVNFGRWEEDTDFALGIGGVVSIGAGLAGGNEGAVGFGWGIIEASEGWTTLDDSVWDQLLEYVTSWPIGGPGHMQVR